MSEARAVLVRIEGRVQGVGFRAFAQDAARALGLEGWVVNRDDGSVEAALYGEGAKLADLVGKLRQGPPAAKVEKVDVQSTDRHTAASVPPKGYSF